MALNSSNVRVAISGELSAGPVGTSAPTTSVSSLNAAFIGLGYVSEDGVTLTPNDTNEQIVAWQNAAVVRTVYTESYWTFQCRLIEAKGEAAEIFYRSDVDIDGAGAWSMDVGAAGTDPRAWVFDVIDGSKHYRYYIPTGEVTERGEQVFANGEPIGFDITITAYADSNGVAFTIFTDDTNWGYS